MNKLSVNRHSGLDILRLLAMFGIVTLHILGHGGLLKMTDGSITGSLIPKTLLAVFCVFVVCLILESLRLQLFRLARIDRLLETIAVRIAKTVNTVSQNHHK